MLKDSVESIDTKLRVTGPKYSMRTKDINRIWTITDKPSINWNRYGNCKLLALGDSSLIVNVDFCGNENLKNSEAKNKEHE